MNLNDFGEEREKKIALSSHVLISTSKSEKKNRNLENI